jgi:hypothetical protein
LKEKGFLLCELACKLERRAHLVCEKGALQGWGRTKDKGRAHKRFGAHSSKQGLTLQARGKGKGKQGKEAHQGKGRLVLRLAGTSLRNSITSLRISLDCIRFLVYLLVVAFAFRSPYIYISLLLVFPMGVFPGSC